VKIWEKFIADIYDTANWTEKLGVEYEGEADANDKSPYILHSYVEKAIKKMGDKKTKRR